jgi:hypothetical protein
VPCLLLYNDGSKLHFVLSSWSLCVVDNLQAATAAAAMTAAKYRISRVQGYETVLGSRHQSSHKSTGSSRPTYILPEVGLQEDSRSWVCGVRF